MKKIIALLMAILLLLSVTTGCGSTSDELTLTVNIASNKTMQPFVDAMKEQFPDVNFDVYFYEGADSTDFLRQTMINDDASDIVFYTQKLEDEFAQKNLIDLSGYSFIGNIDAAMLNRMDSDSCIYQIPGPVVIRSMAYNKTLFEEHGWKVPNTFDELLDVVKQIKEDAPELVPVCMSLGAVGYPFTSVTTFSQAGFLSTPEGSKWEEKYLSGEASVKEGWHEGVQMLSQLIDSGAFKDIDKSIGVWDTDVMDKSFATGEAAMMVVWGGQLHLAEIMENNTDYSFGLFPFYGMSGHKLLGINTTSYWGVSKRLEDKGNEKKLDKALEVMSWIATSQAQSLLVESSAEIPSLKDPDAGSVSEEYLNLWKSSSDSYKQPMVYSGYEDVIVPAGELIQEYILSGKSDGMEDKLAELVDRLHKNTLSEDVAEVHYGDIGEDFSAAQTVQLIANVINDAGVADFALVSQGGQKNGIRNQTGISGWLYKGEINNTNYCIVKPGGGSNVVDVMSLSGEQIKDLISNGKTLYSENEKSANWDYYWSGIEVTMSDGKVTSVQLNGKELEDTATYKVAFIENDYPVAISELVQPEKTELAVNDMYLEYIGANSPVKAPEVLRK